MIERSFEERVRLSAPAMRTFLNIGRRWNLSEEQQSSLLACDVATLREWAEIAQQHKSLALETDTLMRVSVAFGVFADLRQLFMSIAGAHEERRWLSRPRRLAPFHGRAPLELLCGSFEEQMAVRRHLSAAGEGVSPRTEIAPDVPAYSESDIVWTGIPSVGIKAICFDAFGTVVEIVDKRRPFRSLLRNEPSSMLAVRALTQSVGLRELSRDLAIPEGERRLAELEADIEAECASTRRRPGMEQVWSALQRAELKIAICSNLAAPYEQALLAQLPGVPDALVLSFRAGLMKPQYEIYQMVCSQLGLRPSEVLFTGDSREADVIGPSDAGAFAMPIAEFETSYATHASVYAPPVVVQLFERIAAAKAG